MDSFFGALTDNVVVIALFSAIGAIVINILSSFAYKATERRLSVRAEARTRLQADKEALLEKLVERLATTPGELEQLRHEIVRRSIVEVKYLVVAVLGVAIACIIQVVEHSHDPPPSPGHTVTAAVLTGAVGLGVVLLVIVSSRLETATGGMRTVLARYVRRKGLMAGDDEAPESSGDVAHLK